MFGLVDFPCVFVDFLRCLWRDLVLFKNGITALHGTFAFIPFLYFFVI